MTNEQQLIAELKARFNPEQDDELRKIDSEILEKIWKLFKIHHPTMDIQKSVWQESVLELLSIINIIKV